MSKGSKIECEKEVLKANGIKGVLTCTLCPSAIFGLPLPPLPKDQLLIPGMINVSRTRRHRYQTGDNRPLVDFTSRVWAVYGSHIPNKIVISHSVSYALVDISDWIYHLKLLFWDESQLKRGLSKAKLKQAMSSLYFNINKARTILGYESQVILEEGIQLSVAWYKEFYP
ncbi:unnamed protein product [Rhizopus stolonifer]